MNLLVIVLDYVYDYDMLNIADEVLFLLVQIPMELLAMVVARIGIFEMNGLELDNVGLMF